VEVNSLCNETSKLQLRGGEEQNNRRVQQLRQNESSLNQNGMLLFSPKCETTGGTVCFSTDGGRSTNTTNAECYVATGCS
jgi:hypothetical protein